MQEATSGHGEVAGLFNHKGQRGWTLQEGSKVNTITLADFAIQQNITSVLFTLSLTQGDMNQK
jgi:hypothetical protein